MLDSASVDYRDCFEKSELLRRLEDAQKVLPSHVKVRTVLAIGLHPKVLAARAAAKLILNGCRRGSNTCCNEGARLPSRRQQHRHCLPAPCLQMSSMWSACFRYAGPALSSAGIISAVPAQSQPSMGDSMHQFLLEVWPATRAAPLGAPCPASAQLHRELQCPPAIAAPWRPVGCQNPNS